jgi:hypothetical protein
VVGTIEETDTTTEAGTTEIGKKAKSLRHTSGHRHKTEASKGTTTDTGTTAEAGKKGESSQ